MTTVIEQIIAAMLAFLFGTISTVDAPDPVPVAPPAEAEVEQVVDPGGTTWDVYEDTCYRGDPAIAYPCVRKTLAPGQHAPYPTFPPPSHDMAADDSY